MMGLGEEAFATSYALPNSEHCWSAASHMSSPTPCISGEPMIAGSFFDSSPWSSGLGGGVGAALDDSSDDAGDRLSGVVRAFLVPVKSKEASRLIEGGGSVIGLACDCGGDEATVAMVEKFCGGGSDEVLGLLS